jgi:hypothetical protein
MSPIESRLEIFLSDVFDLFDAVLNRSNFTFFINLAEDFLSLKGIVTKSFWN